jgi:hypothetical protein
VTLQAVFFDKGGTIDDDAERDTGIERFAELIEPPAFENSTCGV